MGRGGENFVKTTVRPSGVNVDAKTSPVDTMPGANTTAVSTRSGEFAPRTVRGVVHAASETDATTQDAAVTEIRDVNGMSVRYRRLVPVGSRGYSLADASNTILTRGWTMSS
jgi:hypothetical protein